MLVEPLALRVKVLRHWREEGEGFASVVAGEAERAIGHSRHGRINRQQQPTFRELGNFSFDGAKTLEILFFWHPDISPGGEGAAARHFENPLPRVFRLFAMVAPREHMGPPISPSSSASMAARRKEPRRIRPSERVVSWAACWPTPGVASTVRGADQVFPQSWLVMSATWLSVSMCMFQRPSSFRRLGILRNPR